MFKNRPRLAFVFARTVPVVAADTGHKGRALLPYDLVASSRPGRVMLYGLAGFDYRVVTVITRLADLMKLLLPGKRHWNDAEVPLSTVTVNVMMPPSEVAPL